MLKKHYTYEMKGNFDIKGVKIPIINIKNEDKLKSGKKKINLNAPKINFPSQNINISPHNVELKKK